jgi:hypothetical protein
MFRDLDYFQSPEYAPSLIVCSLTVVCCSNYYNIKISSYRKVGPGRIPVVGNVQDHEISRPLPTLFVVFDFVSGYELFFGNIKLNFKVFDF